MSEASTDTHGSFLRRWKVVLVLGVVACLITCALCARSWWRYWRAEPLDAGWTFHELAVDEPSAIAFHPGRGTLFVASDEGYVSELDTELRVLDRHAIPGDIEGLAVHPIAGTLFVAFESYQAIAEYDIQQKRILRTLNLDLQAHPAFSSKRRQTNEGLEGIAISGDENTGYSLMAIIESDPALMIRVEADLSPQATKQAREESGAAGPAGVRSTVTVAETFDLRVPRMSDVIYDRELGYNLVLCSADRLLLLVDQDGRMAKSFRLPGHRP